MGKVQYRSWYVEWLELLCIESIYNVPKVVSDVSKISLDEAICILLIKKSRIGNVDTSMQVKL